jgi:hypothetical protein
MIHELLTAFDEIRGKLELAPASLRGVRNANS